MEDKKEIKGADFRKMQLLQLDMISELDRVCRKHNILYTISCGTLLGAVRHKGYIPWDDDADITMLREEYEKFKLVANELDPSICFFQDHTTDREYLWGYGKLRRTGTKYIRLGQEHIKCKTGVGIDIFPLDDAPLSVLGQMIQDFDCFLLRKILYARVAVKNSKGVEKAVYSLIHLIPRSYVYRRVDTYAKRSRNDSPNRVRLLLFPSFGKLYLKTNPLKTRYSMSKEWFLDRAEYEFEGYRFWGTKDYDAFLSYMYDDYMTLPDENKREAHAPVADYSF